MSALETGLEFGLAALYRTYLKQLVDIICINKRIRSIAHFLILDVLAACKLIGAYLNSLLGLSLLATHHKPAPLSHCDSRNAIFFSSKTDSQIAASLSGMTQRIGTFVRS